MGSKPRCYVASPLGFNDAGRHYYNSVLLPAISRVVTPQDPWAFFTDEQIADAALEGREAQFARDIGRRNAEAIRDSQLLVAVLDGQDVDSGTAAEVGFATALELPCYGLRTDRRQSGEPGARINLQVEAFILMSNGSIASSLDELLAILAPAAEALSRKAAPSRARTPQTA